MRRATWALARVAAARAINRSARFNDVLGGVARQTVDIAISTGWVHARTAREVCWVKTHGMIAEWKVGLHARSGKPGGSMVRNAATRAGTEA
jgi:hypothetical protein